MPSITLYSSNPVYLDALRIMGASVKTGENPIGQFGTGFKYALAVLLRTGHRVLLRSQDPITRAPLEVSFRTTPTKIRGESFEELTMCPKDSAPIPMGVTTALGKHWEVWQAYRELRSNAMDEAPWEQTLDHGHPAGGPYPTSIRVDGEEFYQIATKRNAVFLDNHPLATTPYGTVGILQSPTAPALYYRGIKVATPIKRPALAYNITTSCSLTEDRTLKYPEFYNAAVAVVISQLVDEELIAAAMAGEYEKSLSPHSEYINNPSPVFVSYVERKKLTTEIPAWARKAVEAYLGKKLLPDSMQLDARDQSRLEDAKRLAKIMAPQFDPEFPLFIAKSLGPETYGLAKGGKVFISYAAFDMGKEFLAATILEEYLHAELGFTDESRALQNWLFQALAGLAAKTEWEGQGTLQVPEPVPTTFHDMSLEEAAKVYQGLDLSSFPCVALPSDEILF